MSFKGVNVLITGADGFIGSHLAEAMAAEGACVTALVQYNSFGAAGWLDDLAPEGRAAMSVVAGDIRDGAHMMRLVGGQDLILHLAALIAIPHSYVAAQSYVDTNVTGTLNLLEAARRAGVRRFVHTSTSEVYGTALTTPMSEDHPLQGQSPYSASKIAADKMAEAYARSFDLPVVTLRPFNTFGPRQSERAVIPSVIRQALDPECETIAVGDLSPVRDFNFVADTVQGFLDVSSSDAVRIGEVYNLGSGRGVTIGETIETIKRLTGANKPVETDARRLRPEKSEVGALLADAGRLTAAVGWQSRVSLEQGLEQTIAWWRQRISGNLQRRDRGYQT